MLARRRSRRFRFQGSSCLLPRGDGPIGAPAPARQSRLLLSHCQPLALFFGEAEQLHGFGLGRLPIRRLNSPEIVGALPQDRDAPATELRGSGPFRWWPWHTA
jgi:hypothetical protein